MLGDAGVAGQAQHLQAAGLDPAARSSSPPRSPYRHIRVTSAAATPGTASTAA